MLLHSWEYADNPGEVMKLDTAGYLILPEESHIYEPSYNGDGKFNGRDVFNLVVLWNRDFIAKHPQQQLLKGQTYQDMPWYPVVSNLNIPDDMIVEECKKRGIEYRMPGIDISLRTIGLDIAFWPEDNELLQYPIKITKELPSFPEANNLPASKFEVREDHIRSFPSYYDAPTQVIFYDEENDEDHGGIAYRDEIICLECGGIFEIAETRIKKEIPWTDILTPETLKKFFEGGV